MIINCKVTDTKLKSDVAQTTRLTKGYLYCKFEFLNPEDWEGTEKHARFENIKSGVKRSAVIDSDGMCLVPCECLTTEGYLNFSAHGERVDGYVINTDHCKTYLRDTLDGGEDSRPPTPNLYIQMLAERAKASESVMTVEQELTEDQRIQARKNIGFEEAMVETLIKLSIAPVILDEDGKIFTDENDALLLNI